VIVLAVEEERGSFPGEVRFERGCLAVQLGGQLRVTGFLDQLEGREEIVRPGFEAAP
jgi:hypothetical protein